MTLVTQCVTASSLLKDAKQLIGIQQHSQFARSRWVPQLAQRFRFDLANTFASDRKTAPDFFERMLRAIVHTEAHSQHALFTRAQSAQYSFRAFLQIYPDHRFRWGNCCAVFDEVAEMRIALFANRRLK